MAVVGNNRSRKDYKANQYLARKRRHEKSIRIPTVRDPEDVRIDIKVSVPPGCGNTFTIVEPTGID